MPTLFFFVENDPCGSFFAAFQSVALNSAEAIGFSEDETHTNGQIIRKLTNTNIVANTTIVMFGLYWEKAISYILEVLPDVSKIFVHTTSDEVKQCENEKVTYLSDGPTDLCKRFDILHSRNPKLHMFDKFKKELALMEASYFGDESNDIYVFLLGIMVLTDDKGLFEGWKSLFNDELTRSTINKKGRKTLEPLMRFVEGRVKERSYTTILSDGTVAAVCESSELFAYTHECLHETYPDVPVTMVTWLNYSVKGATPGVCEINYSLRTHDNRNNLSKLLENATVWQVYKIGTRTVFITKAKLPVP